MQKEIYWLKNKKLFRFLKIAGVLLIPVLLFLVPLQSLENQHSICLYKNLTGYECFGCGMTRAVVSAIHFQFEKAFHYNRLFLIVLPLLFYIWSRTLINLWSGTTAFLKNYPSR
jgi:hypothetical protein